MSHWRGFLCGVSTTIVMAGLTLEDTVEFFNLVLELQLNAQEKTDIVAFMRQL